MGLRMVSGYRRKYENMFVTMLIQNVEFRVQNGHLLNTFVSKMGAGRDPEARNRPRSKKQKNAENDIIVKVIFGVV